MKKWLGLLIVLCAITMLVTSCDASNPNYVSIVGVTPHDSGMPAVPYYYLIGDGDVANHTPWAKLGYNPLLSTTEADIWPFTGTYVFPTAPQQMQVVSTDNVADVGTITHAGTSTSGSTTSLTDTTANFLAGTAVVAGDCLLIDTTHEYGIVTTVAATTLTVSGGFSSLGSGAGQTYRVIPFAGTAGAKVLGIQYLDNSYNNQYEYDVLNGTTAVNTVAKNILRINEFIVAFAGANEKPTGSLSLRNLAGTSTYGYIINGYTRSRSSVYTVPAGYTLFVVSVTFSFGYAANQTHYARLYTRATQHFLTQPGPFRTAGIFYPFSEVVCANNAQQITLDVPTRIASEVDMKVSGISDTTGAADVVLRGWLQPN